MNTPDKKENPSPRSSAIKSPHDDRDYLFEDIAMSAVPFNWDVGYDGEEELAEITKVASFTIKPKDQGVSGSCGGQSEGYAGATIEAIHTGNYEERSAKFAYAPVAYPGGGSTGRDLATRAINFGWGLESLTTSYQNGNPPSEDFMQRKQDITQQAIDEAKKSKALSYTLLPIDMDTIAQALRDFKAVRIGVTGSNNGTWLTTDPKPPRNGEQHWYHWITILKAKKRNGKKAFGFINSWGDQVGDRGWQWLNEDWFKPQLTNNPYGAIPVWEPRCYTWNEQPVDTAFRHHFFKELDYGQQDDECIQVQTALRVDGVFPEGIPYSRNFGVATREAVRKFQSKYGIVNSGTSSTTGYGRVGPKTIAKLNELFDK